MVVKTYRGLLANSAEERIPLSTKDGSVGYRVIKFQIIDAAPGTLNTENIVKIYTESQTAVGIDGAVDFSDNELLGMAFWVFNASNPQYATTDAVIFDREIFNQDIYITNRDVSGNASKCNYYIELEQMKLDHTQNMSVTLKAIRGSALD